MDGPRMGTELLANRAVSVKVGKTQKIKANAQQAYYVHLCVLGIAPKGL